jgi:hypothetical protein
MKTEEMDEFERKLTQRMRPVSAPETLAKFLAIAAEAEQARRERRRWWMWFRLRTGARTGSKSGGVMVLSRPMAWTGFAMVAAMLLVVFVGQQVHVRRDRERAVVATQEFEAATQIEDQTMAHTREQLERAGIRLEQ